MTAEVALSPAARNLLDALRFRAPDPCYLVPTGYGREALVVTKVTGDLERHTAVNRATVRELGQAELIGCGQDVPVPVYRGRRRHDARTGYQVWITNAGRALFAREAAARMRSSGFTVSAPEPLTLPRPTQRRAS